MREACGPLRRAQTRICAAKATRMPPRSGSLHNGAGFPPRNGPSWCRTRGFAPFAQNETRRSPPARMNTSPSSANKSRSLQLQRWSCKSPPPPVYDSTSPAESTRSSTRIITAVQKCARTVTQTRAQRLNATRAAYFPSSSYS